ncbi:MAG: response regulator transcription factor [Rhizorhabdus sp.]|jgi:two-component system OmpR family response regulator|nr:MAG: response regulator transcription factor [Rhizorhabdus sp.]
MGQEDDTIEHSFRRLFLGRSALILEDEAEVAELIAAALERAGFGRVDVVGNGRDAVERAGADPFDILILDRQTPELDGLGALGRIRAEGGRSSRAPALFLTALGSERHRVEGLAAGGDDYAVKPLSEIELLARLAALLRRREWDSTSPRDTALACGPLRIDIGAMTASLCGHMLDLTAREFSILSLLARNIGLPVTRSMLWSVCWSTYNFVPANFANTIDVHVSRLRRKLEASGSELPASLNPLIVAVRSQGLMLRRLDGAG